jgi:hypothetical protein
MLSPGTDADGSPAASAGYDLPASSEYVYSMLFAALPPSTKWLTSGQILVKQ